MRSYSEYTKADLMRLLESLTPGGSEFYESPENCARFIRERKGKPCAAPQLLEIVEKLASDDANDHRSDMDHFKFYALLKVEARAAMRRLEANDGTR